MGAGLAGRRGGGRGGGGEGGRGRERERERGGGEGKGGRDDFNPPVDNLRTLLCYNINFCINKVIQNVCLLFSSSLLHHDNRAICKLNSNEVRLIGSGM